MPRISVISPVYNIRPYLRRFLISYQKQTLTDTELILIDDCSTDGSYELAASFASNDPRIRLLRNPCNMGSGQSRNRAMREASGEYIYFADPDDLFFSPTSLSHIYATAASFNSEITVCNYQLVFSQNNDYYCPPFGEPLFSKARFFEWSESPLHPNIWQCLFKRTFLKAHPQICFAESRRFQDVYFMLQARIYSSGIAVTPHFVYAYRCYHRFLKLTSASIREFLAILPEITALCVKAGVNLLGNLLESPITPGFITYVYPKDNLNLDTLTRYYDMTSEEAKALLREYQDVKDSLREKFPELTKLPPRLRNGLTASPLGRSAHLTFAPLPDETYLERKLSVLFSRVRYIHLLSPVQDFSLLIHKTLHNENPQEHLFIYVRSGDMLPFFHMHPPLKDMSVLSMVNLQALTSLLPVLKQVDRIYLHSFEPRPTYIFLNRHPELLSRCVLRIYGEQDFNRYADDPVLRDVIGTLSEVEYLSALDSFRDSFPLRADCLVKKLNLPELIELPCLPETREERNLVLILSDDTEYILSTLPTLRIDKGTQICCLYSNILPGRLHELKQAVNARFAHLPLTINAHYLPIAEFLTLLPKLKELHVYNRLSPPPIAVMALAYRAGIPLKSGYNDLGFLESITSHAKAE